MYGFCTTMEIQSGNGEEAANATSGSVSRGADAPQVEVLREDLQAAKTIERFDIPLDSLKRMFEKPATTNTVSILLFLFFFCAVNIFCLALLPKGVQRMVKGQVSGCAMPPAATDLG